MVSVLAVGSSVAANAVSTMPNTMPCASWPDSRRLMLDTPAGNEKKVYPCEVAGDTGLVEITVPVSPNAAGLVPMLVSCPSR